MSKEDIKVKVKEMIAAPSCHPDLQATGKAWLYEFGKDGEYQASQDLITEIENCIMTVEKLTAFVVTPQAKEIFGDRYEAFANHVAELKEKGAIYCDCGACTPALEILQNKEVILD